MLARSVTINTAGQIGSLVIGFAGSVALARWLGPSDRGLVAVIVSVNALTLAVVGLGLPVAAQYYASRGNAQLRLILGNTLAYGALLAVVLVPAYWLLEEQLSNVFAAGRGDTTWALAAVLVPLAFLQYTTASHLWGRLRFGLYNVLVVVSKVVYVLCLVVFLQVVGLGVAGALLALAAMAAVVFVGSLVAAIAQAGTPRLGSSLFRDMLRYGLRAQVGALFRILYLRIDVIILQFYWPLAEVGYYAVAVVVAELVLTFTGAFQLSVLPLLSRYEDDARQATTSVSAIKHHGILMTFAIVGNAIVGPLIILYAFGSEFSASLTPMLILLPAMWFLGTGALVGSDLSGRGRPGLGSILAGGAVVLIVGLDLLLVPAWGAVGAATASLIAYAVFGLASLATLARVADIPPRDLVVPERAELGLYRHALRRAIRGIRRRHD